MQYDIYTSLRHNKLAHLYNTQGDIQSDVEVTKSWQSLCCDLLLGLSSVNTVCWDAEYEAMVAKKITKSHIAVYIYC